MASIADILSDIDNLRRLLGSGKTPLAEVYLEAARGNLHHAREALMRYDRSAGKIVTYKIEEGARLDIVAGEPLCHLHQPDGWTDGRRPARADLGAELMASDDARLASATWHSGGMLVAALADHAWLDLKSGTSWSTDRAGARALIGAMNMGRPVAYYDAEMLCGTLDLNTVQLLAAIGWRRLRSPKLIESSP